MKKCSNQKGLLLDWLKKALDGQLYHGLKWSDKKKGIFYILWTHKSAEQWSDGDLEPFIAWAQFKGKLNGKNPKQLKATFRCALNSKSKELREILELRTRSRRYWQFIDPNSAPSEEKDNSTPKKKRKSTAPVAAIPSTSSSQTFENNSTCGIPSIRLDSSSEAEMSNSEKLPAFESICSFASLTPPHQTAEISYEYSNQPQMYEQETRRKERCRLSPDTADRTSPEVLLSDISSLYTSSLTSPGRSYEAGKSTSAMLPCFEALHRFLSLTPPPQKTDVYFCTKEYRTNYTPPPDHSRLTPVEKNHNSSTNTFHQLDKDVWQPNDWTTSSNPQDYSVLNPLPNDLIEMYKSTNQELENSYMDFFEMDQSVPVMDISYSAQVLGRNVLFNPTNKIDYFSDELEQMNLDNEDYALINDIAGEAYKKVFQELDRLSTNN